MPDEPLRGTSASHLSIGEVLALLLEEFPDITISKIRFLESQGLIDPERTPSGYRKFYDHDVELLRCILREQRENYLPLRVIKDRLDSGEIDPTSETARPRGIRNVSEPVEHTHPSTGSVEPVRPAAPAPTEPSTPATDSSPALLHGDAVDSDQDADAPADPEPSSPPPARIRTATTQLLPGVVLTADELCSMVSISRAALESLVSYGVISTVKGSGGMYGEEAVDIARISKRFLDAGFDARHLRGWKVAADREAGLFEQMIQPLVRQRNPQARAQAQEQLAEMESIGGDLRRALMRAAMRSHFDQ